MQGDGETSETEASRAPARRAGRAPAGPDRAGRRPARPRKPRDSLNRAVIVEAGIAIAQRDGLEGLTFQALGDELQAHATSMYRHFRDKDELLLEILDTLRERSYGGAVVSTGDWREDLRLQVGHIRAHYLRHAQFAHPMSLRSTHRTIEFTNLEFSLDALSRAGLSADDAVLYARLIGNYVRAMASFEAALSLEPDLRVKDRIQMQAGSLALDPDRFPHLVRSASSLLGLDDPRVFDLGLEAILDRIEALGKGKG